MRRDVDWKWDMFRHFIKGEFACKCCGKEDINIKLVLMLDGAREIAGIPFKITSGYRCESHNKNVGGVPNSQHTLGYAADIATTSETRYEILKALIEEGFKSIIIYEDFLHVDIRQDSIGIQIGF